MSDWYTVRVEDIKDEPARRGPHVLKSLAKIPWLRWCRYCGHVPSKAGISQLIFKIGCHYDTDARYQAWVKGGRKPI